VNGEPETERERERERHDAIVDSDADTNAKSFREYCNLPNEGFGLFAGLSNAVTKNPRR